MDIFKKDTWLSRHLGKDCYHLPTDYEGSPEDVASVLSSLPPPFFMDAKTSTGNFRSIHLLEDLEFRLIDTNIRFSAETSSIPAVPSPPGFLVRWAEPDDEERVGDLAGRCIERSRFHLDPLIPKETADELKADWLRNFFHGKRGDRLALAFHGEEPVAFLQIILSEEAWIIDLVGCLPQFRGRRIGSAAISFAARELRSFPKVLVGTQIVNDGSVRFYERLGFYFHSAQYVFHLHKDRR